MQGKNMILWFRNWIFLLISVGLGVLITFLPLLTAKGNWAYADYTKNDWILWAITKTISLILCFMIFVNMVSQGKLLASKSEEYKEAVRLLGLCKKEGYIPESPTKHNAKLFGRKGTTMILTTGLMMIAFTDSVLTLNWNELIAYFMTWVSSMLFGLMTMTNEEEWWRVNFLEYAKWKYEEFLRATPTNTRGATENPLKIESNKEEEAIQ